MPRASISITPATLFSSTARLRVARSTSTFTANDSVYIRLNFQIRGTSNAANNDDSHAEIKCGSPCPC